MPRTVSAIRSSRGRRWASNLGRLTLLGGLLALTAWNLTRSDALAQATEAYRRGDLVVSLQRALDYLERRPWSREAKLLAARCLSRLDLSDAAEPYYGSPASLSLEDQQTRAYGLLRGNHRQRAIQAYEQLLERWPDNVLALRRLAAVQFTENNAPQLEGLAARLMKTPGGEVIGLTLRGAVAHHDRNYEQAVESLDRVLRLDPDLREMPLPRPTFWNFLASNLIKVGRNDDACRYLDRALGEAADPELLNLQGRAYLLQGKLDEAARCYGQAAEWEPENYLPHLDLGKIELQRQRPEQARAHLEQALKLAPRRMDVLLSLASAYQLLQRPAEAERVREQITRLREGRERAHNPREPWPRYAL